MGQKLHHHLRLPGYHPQVGLQLDNLRLDPGEEMRLGPAARAALSHARDQWARGLPPSLPAVRASLRLGGHGYDVLEALLQRIDTPVGGVVGGILGAITLGLLGFVCYMYSREKQGNPVFQKMDEAMVVGATATSKASETKTEMSSSSV